MNGVYQKYFGYLPLPFSITALLLSLLFAVAVYKAIRLRRVSKKCYLLLFNRTIGDILCCLSMLALSAYVLASNSINQDIPGVFETLYMSCFWSGMTSYISICILKFYAVWRPFNYRKVITMRRCMYIIIFSWVFFAVMVVAQLSVVSMVKVKSLNVWSGCKIETCLRIMYRARNFLAVIVYASTLIVYAFTMVFVHRSQKFVESFRRKDDGNGSQRRTRFPLWKLSLNVATFAAFDLLYVIFSSFMMLQDQCFFQHNLPEMLAILAYIKCSLLMRIIADPIISFFTDFQIRRGLLTWLPLKRRVTVDSRSTIISRNITNDDEAVYQNPTTVTSDDSQH